MAAMATLVMDQAVAVIVVVEMVVLVECLVAVKGEVVAMAAAVKQVVSW